MLVMGIVANVVVICGGNARVNICVSPQYLAQIPSSTKVVWSPRWMVRCISCLGKCHVLVGVMGALVVMDASLSAGGVREGCMLWAMMASTLAAVVP